MSLNGLVTTTNKIEAVTKTDYGVCDSANFCSTCTSDRLLLICDLGWIGMDVSISFDAF